MVQKVVKNNKFSCVFVISILQYVQEEEGHSHRHREQQIHPKKDGTNAKKMHEMEFYDNLPRWRKVRQGLFGKILRLHRCFPLQKSKLRCHEVCQSRNHALFLSLQWLSFSPEAEN